MIDVCDKRTIDGNVIDTNTPCSVNNMEDVQFVMTLWHYLSRFPTKR